MCTVSSDGLQPERLGFDSLAVIRISLLHNIQSGSGVHLASYVIGVGVSFPGGNVVGHSPPSSAKVSYTSIPA